jgi:pimeloyl-ACP methyl ester carboxylesterase
LRSERPFSTTTAIAHEQVGAGPALVMVDPAAGFHGFRPTEPLIPLLANRFTVLTYDRRGRGHSGETLPYSVDREVADLRAVIEEAGGSAYVFGFSSGAALAMHTAGPGVLGLALLEPPVDFDAPPSPLGAEVTELVAAGRRGDAVEHFNRSIGVPTELIAGLRQAPFWPGLEALAHTLVYDTLITESLTSQRLAEITVPTLVVNGEESDERLVRWAREVAAALPNGRHRSLPGRWHMADPTLLAAEITAFFLD